MTKQKELGERYKLQAEKAEMRDRKHPAVGKRRQHHQVHVVLTVSSIASPLITNKTYRMGRPQRTLHDYLVPNAHDPQEVPETRDILNAELNIH